MTKQIQNPKHEIDQPRTPGSVVFGALSFDIVSDFGFRTSTFLGGAMASLLLTCLTLLSGCSTPPSPPSSLYLFDRLEGDPGEGLVVAIIAADGPAATRCANELQGRSPRESVAYIESLGDTEGLIITPTGEEVTTAGWDAALARCAADAKDEAPKANPNWPTGYQVTIDVKLATISSAKYRRPYVAVWIEDPKDPNVRTRWVRFLTVWGKQAKYQRDLRNFFTVSKYSGRVLDAVTRPTRGPGEYTVTWDGLDEDGKPVPAGEYRIHVEVAREHGTDQHMSKVIALRDAKAEVTMPGNVEVSGVVVRFSPPKQ